jgi:hypothetical protein
MEKDFNWKTDRQNRMGNTNEAACTAEGWGKITLTKTDPNVRENTTFEKPTCSLEMTAPTLFISKNGVVFTAIGWLIGNYFMRLLVQP